MKKVQMMGMVLALITVANVAMADGDESEASFEVKGFDAACRDAIRKELCDGYVAPPAAQPAPQRDPEVDALKARLEAIEAEKAKKAAARKGPGAFERASDAIKVAKGELEGRIAELQRQIEDLKAKQPSGDELENALVPIRAELAELQAEDEKLREALEQEREERMTQDDLMMDNDMAQSQRMDNHDRMLLALVRDVDQITIEGRPIMFSLNLAPMYFHTEDGTDITVLGITPQLDLPLGGTRWDLQLEASPLLSGDTNPFGGQARVALGYVADPRLQLNFGLATTFIGYDHALKAASALVTGDVGLKFSPVKWLNLGFNVMAGVEQDRDRHSAFAFGGRLLVGVNPFR